MSYRGLQQARHGLSTDMIMQYAGQTATWRQAISASAGVSVAGFGSATYYRTQLITGLFGSGIMDAYTLTNRPAGALPAGMIRIVTRETLGVNDEIVWNGETYRVDSEPVRSTLNGRLVATLVRGES